MSALSRLRPLAAAALVAAATVSACSSPSSGSAPVAGSGDSSGSAPSVSSSASQSAAGPVSTASSAPSASNTSPAPPVSPGGGAVAGGAAVDAAARALLPDEIKTKGVLVDGVNLPNPPMEFTDAGGSAPKGLDIDLATALGARLGVRITFDNVQFDQLLPGLATRRDDLVLSALSDTAERQKVATWIDYFNSGDRFFIAAADQQKYPNQQSLCGQTVVVASGTSFVEDVPALSTTTCAGKAPIKVLAVGISGNAGLELQLTTGRAAAAVTGAETYGYLTRTEAGKWAAVGDIFAKSPYGLAVRPADTQLRDALTAALTHMVADGSYGKILAAWGQQASAVQKVTVNLH